MLELRRGALGDEFVRPADTEEGDVYETKGVEGFADGGAETTSQRAVFPCDKKGVGLGVLAQEVEVEGFDETGVDDTNGKVVGTKEGGGFASYFNAVAERPEKNFVESTLDRTTFDLTT